VRANELAGIYNLVDDSQLTVKGQLNLICDRYSLPPVNWDPSKLSIQRKSVQVCNEKIKSVGYELIHPQIII
jgi:hypothetical protein